MIVRLLRASSWVSLATIVVLTLVPPAAPPVTGAPHFLEHASIFLMTGMLFALAYEIKTRSFILGAIAFSVGLEIIQSFDPGRHARLSDALIDATSMCVGILLSRAAIRLWLFCRNAWET